MYKQTIKRDGVIYVKCIFDRCNGSAKLQIQNNDFIVGVKPGFHYPS